MTRDRELALVLTALVFVPALSRISSTFGDLPARHGDAFAVLLALDEVLRRVDLTAADPAPEAQRMWHVTLLPDRRAVAVAREQPLKRGPVAEEARCPVHPAPSE